MSSGERHEIPRKEMRAGEPQVRVWLQRRHESNRSIVSPPSAALTLLMKSKHCYTDSLMFPNLKPLQLKTNEIMKVLSLSIISKRHLRQYWVTGEMYPILFFFFGGRGWILQVEDKIKNRVFFFFNFKRLEFCSSKDDDSSQYITFHTYFIIV